MKSYIYTITDQKRGKGLINIYKLNGGKRPQWVAKCNIYYGLTKGGHSEVLARLVEIGELDEHFMQLSKCEWRGSGYYCPEVEQEGVYIYDIE